MNAPELAPAAVRDLNRDNSLRAATDLFDTVTEAIRRFKLTSLEPGVRVCLTLANDETPLDVAVLGQFKSGKSSLLNALVGNDLLPIGVVPVTAVVTRLVAGPALTARVRDQDGRPESIAPERIAEFVTEALNPGNCRRVAVVDVEVPALAELRGLRLVDTPGLGSTFAHNTQATKDWLPSVAAALVVVSADRPLSNDERLLIAEVRQLAPRVWVILSKIDLLDIQQQAEVTAFLQSQLHESFGNELPVIPFSVRRDREQSVGRLRTEVLRPLIQDPARERHAVFVHKVQGLATACHDYLRMALQSALRVSADRERLRSAVLDETVREAVIRDELALTCQRMCDGIRSAFEARFDGLIGPIQQRLAAVLREDMRSWRGHLGKQTHRYETWIRERMTSELTGISELGLPLARELVAEAESRFRRVVDAFRDRLARNLTRELNVTLSPLTWEVHVPVVVMPDAAFSKTFATNWELLWWLIPMPLFGWLFRRHCLGLLPWEVEKNVFRLEGDWYAAVVAAVNDLREQALAWVRAELATLGQLLARDSDEVPELEERIRRLEAGLVKISQ
jgi:GTP-binding protein EngB required for normal cell division